MNNKKDLIKEAIADAKAVREVALANAKLALQEAFEPKLKTIMSAHLEEELSDNDIKEEELEEMMRDEKENEEGKMEEEIDINALLAELEEASKDSEYEEEEDANLEEAKEKEEKEEGEEGEEEEGEEKEEEDIDVGDMTKEDIIDLIRQEISAQLSNDEMEGDMGADETGDMMGDEDMEDMMMEGEDTEDGLAPNIMNALKEIAAESGMELSELLSQASAAVGNTADQNTNMAEGNDKDLEEAFKTITILKNELNEVNLLNAKLLYANKLFNKYSLSESQKLKVINSFDNAETVRETKLVYNTLNESFESETKQTKQKSKSLTEGLGIASKPTGVSKPTKQTLNESNEFVSRLQKLANIKL